jgi:tRNA (cmo5U34)-methyltransferase
LRFDDRSVWSADVSRLITAYAKAARSGPRMNHLLPVFGRIALGTAGRPDIATATLDETLVHDVEVRQFYHEHLNHKTERFQHHAHASIPFILEEHCRLGVAISAFADEQVAAGRRPLRLWSLGSAEAPMARAAAEKSQGAVEVLCSSENSENFATLSRVPEPHVRYHVGPFYDVAKPIIDGPRSSSPEWDVVFEHTSFQMHHRDRLAPLLLLRRTMNESGVALLYEKTTDPDRAAYERRELEKDRQFKSRFFSAPEIQAKKTTVLADMEKGQVTYEELVAICRLVFRSVSLIWKSGNFVGVAASNDENRLRRLIELMPPPAVENRSYTEGLPVRLGAGAPLHFRAALSAHS